MTAVLTIRDLDVSYGGVSALRGISLDVLEGEVLGVLGPNGAGKSSLAGAVIGSVRTARGLVLLDDRRIERLPMHKRTRLGVSISPEGRGVLGELSVVDNLLLGTYAVRPMPRDTIAARLDEAISLFPVLGERQHQRASTLSGGEAAMLSVARAMMAHPRILILDEPSLGLAPLVAAALFERLAALKATGQTMLIVEQRSPDLLRLADHLIVLRRAEIVERIDASMASDEHLRDVYFGRAHGAS